MFVFPIFQELRRDYHPRTNGKFASVVIVIWKLVHKTSWNTILWNKELLLTCLQFDCFWCVWKLSTEGLLQECVSSTLEIRGGGFISFGALFTGTDWDRLCLCSYKEGKYVDTGPSRTYCTTVKLLMNVFTKVTIHRTTKLQLLCSGTNSYCVPLESGSELSCVFGWVRILELNWHRLYTRTAEQFWLI